MNEPGANQNRKTAIMAAGVVIVMVGLSFAAVPAYRAFCQATGFDGTTQRADKPADTVLDRKITVRFDATVNEGLPWTFKPEQVGQTLRIGETGLAFYHAVNLTDAPVTGRATFNVQPAKAGIYFKKIECFCFTEQTLQPGESVSMPVTFSSTRRSLTIPTSTMSERLRSPTPFSGGTITPAAGRRAAIRPDCRSRAASAGLGIGARRAL